MGQGVRKLKIADALPDCEIVINRPAYHLEDYVANKTVVDVGCGYGETRKPVEELGGKWIGVEPFEGGAHTIVGRAEALPLEDASCDVVVMNAVLEHVQDAGKAFSEVARILRPGGYFLGYAAFMECFHEISYSHLSFKALEYYAQASGMRLEKLGGGGRFGIDYHLRILFYPLPFGAIRAVLAAFVRGLLRLKAAFAVALLILRRLSLKSALALASSYFKLECLRQSVGFTFVIRKPPIISV
jgi:SAM-dependent methyltransferase